MAKKIVSIKAINAGSPPDVDTDFNTKIRSQVFDHVAEVHGRNNITSIITFNSLAAKGSFKEMCTIYEVPYKTADSISKLVPPPIDGADCKFRDIFNPESNRYSEASEFRAATSGDEWKQIIESSLAIEGRYKSTGIHPCGMIISSKDLRNIIPMKTVKDKGNNRVVSQWTYPELESLGLIKFDFLNLDTVDLIQHTVERIIKAGKTPPNMIDIVHGPMDDKKTFEMIARGDTVGVFQLGSNIVQDFMFIMKPTSFNDIAASTAMLRPGPMAMNTHTRYANRKNGNEKIEPIHPDFKGSPLDEILKDTYSLIIYQEQVMQIANRIANFTLKEADTLRSAMGKKKIDKMNSMKGKFYEGAESNGYSTEAVDILWDTIAEFSKYAFNKSHSVAYAMSAYQTAYLKAHYPVEFISALISQKIDDKDKVLEYLHEARRMGLKIGPTNINLSDVEVSPNYKHNGDYDIIYGLSGVKAVSEDTAETIINEREENGEYISVQNMVNRCVPLGINNRKVYENLALSGAFDTFNVPRKAVVNNLESMIVASKTKSSRGLSLFDFGGMEENTENEIDLTKFDEYDFVEKTKNEADVIGLYLTEHPLSKMGDLPNGVTTITELKKAPRTTTKLIVGSISSMVKKTRKGGGRSIMVTIDDGNQYLNANVDNNLVKGMNRHASIKAIETAYLRGRNEVSDEVKTRALDDSVQPLPELEENSIYVFKVTYRPAFSNGTNYSAKVVSATPLKLSHDGVLPIRIRIKDKTGKSLNKYVKGVNNYARKLSEKYNGEYPIHYSIYNSNDEKTLINLSTYVRKILETMKNADKSEKDTLPAFRYSDNSYRMKTNEELAATLEYSETNFSVDKNNIVDEKLSNSFGFDKIDYGIYIELDEQ